MSRHRSQQAVPLRVQFTEWLGASIVADREPARRKQKANWQASVPSTKRQIPAKTGITLSTFYMNSHILHLIGSSLVHDVIVGALQARFIALTDDSGIWPCDFSGAQVVRIKVPRADGDFNFPVRMRITIKA